MARSNINPIGGRLDEVATSGGIRSVWCDDCQTSAAYEWTIYLMSEPYPGVARVEPAKTVQVCENCDPDAFADYGDDLGGDSGVLV